MSRLLSVLAAATLAGLAGCGSSSHVTLIDAAPPASSSSPVDPSGTVATTVPPDASPAALPAPPCAAGSTHLALAATGVGRLFHLTATLTQGGTTDCSVSGGTDLPGFAVAGDGGQIWAAGCDHRPSGHPVPQACDELAQIVDVPAGGSKVWTQDWDTGVDDQCGTTVASGDYTASAVVGLARAETTLHVTGPTSVGSCAASRPAPSSTGHRSSGHGGTATGGGVSGSTGTASSGPGHLVTPGPTTSPSPAAASCTAADVRVTVATDRSSYAPDQTVQITVSLTNTSDRTCWAPGRDPGAPDVRASNAGGTEVWHSGCGSADGAEHPCPLYASQQVPLDPGASEAFTATWQQRASSGTASPGPVVPAGTYTLRCRMVATGTTTVTLTG